MVGRIGPGKPEQSTYASTTQALEQLELLCRQLRLTGPLVRLRQAVMGLRQIGREPRGVPQFLNRLGIPLLVRQQDAELEERLLLARRSQS